VAGGARCRRGRARLIIQPIRQDRSGSYGIDGASNVSRPDPSGADQSDAEHQATDVVLGSQVLSLACRQARDPPRFATRLGCYWYPPRCRDATEGGSAGCGPPRAGRRRHRNASLSGDPPGGLLGHPQRGSRGRQLLGLRHRDGWHELLSGATLTCAEPACSRVQRMTSISQQDPREPADVSFRLSFHLALLGPTGAHWLDDPADLTCKDSTRQHAMDGWPLSCKQQVGGSSPPASSNNSRSQACSTCLA
jgi:hypothetical protein